MNYYELGAGLMLGAGIIGAIVYLHVRLMRVECQLIQEMQKNEDQKIVAAVERLSDAEIDGLIGKNLGRKP